MICCRVIGSVPWRLGELRALDGSDHFRRVLCESSGRFPEDFRNLLRSCTSTNVEGKTPNTMTNNALRTMFLVFFTGTAIFAGDQQPAPAQQDYAKDVAPLLEAMNTVGTLFTVPDKAAAPADQPQGLEQNVHGINPSNVTSPVHDLKRVVVLISTGAAAGAAIGGAAGKNAKSAVIGGVAGLIYDRISQSKPEKPSQAALPSGAVNQLSDVVQNN